MKVNHIYRIIIVLASLMSIAALTIAYAAVSKVVQINGISNIKGNSWSIKFKNLKEPVLYGNAQMLENATISTNTIDFKVSLEKTNDKIEYTWDVVNDGTIDAKLSETPVLNGINEAIKNNVSYTLTYEDGTELNKNDELNKKTSKTIKLTITYLNNNQVTQLSVLNMDTTLTYIQK